MKRYQRIMIAVDGSEEARHALERGISLARQMKGELLLCHIITSDDYSRVRVYRNAIRQAAVDNGISLLEAGKKAAEEAGVEKVATIMNHGDAPARHIAREIAPLYNADMVIAGASGAGRGDRRMLGSVSAGIAHAVGCDVLVVKNHSFEERYRSILVGINSSSLAMEAYEVAMAIAQEHGSSLAAVRVIPPRKALAAEEELVDSQKEEGALEDPLVQRYQRLAEEGGIQHFRMDIRYGAPQQMLPGEAAREYKADLLVIGSIGFGTERKEHLNRLSEAVVRKADCDVLLIRHRGPVKKKAFS